MAATMSATEARVHFGDLFRRVSESGETIVVERSGREQVVVLPRAEFDRLTNIAAGSAGSVGLERAARVAGAIQRRIGPAALPDAAEMVRAGRDERDAEQGDGP